MLITKDNLDSLKWFYDTYVVTQAFAEYRRFSKIESSNNKEDLNVDGIDFLVVRDLLERAEKLKNKVSSYELTYKSILSGECPRYWVDSKYFSDVSEEDLDKLDECSPVFIKGNDLDMFLFIQN